MNYYIKLLLIFVIAYVLTELVQHIFLKKKIIVTIKHKDGTTSRIPIFLGGDPEVDQLVEEAKKEASGKAN